jgi:hypothetical protein
MTARGPCNYTGGVRHLLLNVCVIVVLVFAESLFGFLRNRCLGFCGIVVFVFAELVFKIMAKFGFWNSGVI